MRNQAIAITVVLLGLFWYAQTDSAHRLLGTDRRSGPQSSLGTNSDLDDGESVAQNSCPTTGTSCGDGNCVESTSCKEDISTCPIDCAAPGTIRKFGAEAGGSVRFNLVTGPEPSGSTVTYLIIRAEGAAPTFVPKIGVQYFPNQVFENSTIIAFGTAPESSDISASLPVDTSVVAGKVYYYHAYQGNLFPRYDFTQQPRSDSVDLVQFTFTKTGSVNNAAATGPGWTCGNGCTTASETYERNANVTISFSGDPGATWVLSGACTGTGSSCNIDMVGDKTLDMLVTYVAPPGGGGGGGGGGGCFLAGTLVDTPSGAVPIQQLRPGDQIYAYDVASNRRVVTTVEHLLVHQPEPYGRATFQEGKPIYVTMAHSFYVPQSGSWKGIGHFQVGESALRYSGLGAKSDALVDRQPVVGTDVVYNLTVRKYHNYFVQGMLVHNLLKQP